MLAIGPKGLRAIRLGLQLCYNEVTLTIFLSRTLGLCTALFLLIGCSDEYTLPPVGISASTASYEDSSDYRIGPFEVESVLIELLRFLPIAVRLEHRSECQSQPEVAGIS